MKQTQAMRLWNRNFTILWVGLIQSYLGDAFLTIGLMWLVLEKTGSPLGASTVLVLQGSANLLGPLAGTIVDRSSKRWLLITSDLVRGILLIGLFGLELLNVLQIWHLYVMVVVLSLFSIFYGPALRVILPAIVPNTSLPAANSWVQGGSQIATIVGSSLAGVLLWQFGAELALLVDGISYVVAALVLLFVRFPPEVQQTIGLNVVWRDMVGGVRYIFTTPVVLTLTVLAFFINLILSPVNVIFPIFSSSVLGAGVSGYGLLASAIAAGLLAGTALAGIMGDRLSYNQSTLIGLVGMSITLAGLSLAQGLILALSLTAGLGMMAPLIQVPLVSRLQRVVPREFQGRVFATLNTLVKLSLPLSAALAGQALVSLPIPLIFRIGALGTLLMAGIWVGLNYGLLRRKPNSSAAELLK